MTDHATRARAWEIWAAAFSDYANRKDQRVWRDVLLDHVAAALDQAAQEAARFVAQEKDTLLQEFCNLQVLYGEQKHTIRALQAAQPVWSKERPTVAGQYWFREPSVAPYVVQIGSDGHGIWIWWECKWQPLDDWTGEWAGPLPLPREA